jgi:23S rRNA pseudouridine955/2504/2580 synthase
MKQIEITANDAGRRLDRFLRKYLPKASLSSIYKIIRKDVKVDGRRRGEEYILAEGEILSLYLSDDKISELRGDTDADFSDGTSGDNRSNRNGGSNKKARRNFKIIYEDENILAVDKPFGLLTHGDGIEKKNHLANQVKDYLIEKGDFNPRTEKVFAPAPANRLDRNTTGIVICGKTSPALKGLNEMIRKDLVRKFYVTIVHGRIDSEMRLGGYLVKDHNTNKVEIRKASPEGKEVVTIVRPIKVLSDGRNEYTYIEVELVTGRTHQIRAHLASISHPLIGDVKYGGKKVFGLSTQLLHAVRLEFSGSVEGLEYLEDMTLEAPLPEDFEKILEALN